MRRLSYEEKKVILAHDFGGSFPTLHSPAVVGLFMRTVCHHRNAYESNPFLDGLGHGEREKEDRPCFHQLLSRACLRQSKGLP